MAEGLWPEESRVAAGLAANAVTMELVTMLQSRGVLADADAFAVMTGAIESLRRMAQEQPHPVWDSMGRSAAAGLAAGSAIQWGRCLGNRLRRPPGVRRRSWLFLPWSRRCDYCFFARD